jgi:hypothetical protein
MTMADEQSLLIQAVKDGIRDGVKSRMGSNYNNPIDKVIDSVLANEAEKMRGMIASSISSALDDKQFVNEIKQAIRSKLASILVQKFGGELEKQVNALKRDPTTRARITVAIDKIVQERTGVL